MKLSIAATLSLAVSALAAATPQTRSLSSNHGTVTAPSGGSSVTPTTSLPFAYSNSHWCQDGYSSLTVWLTDYAPGSSNVNPTTGVVSPATHSYGTFTQPNFGLPPLSNQLPSTLTIPDLSGEGLVAGDELYLTVVERAANCPPGNQPAQYGFTSVHLTYA